MEELHKTFSFSEGLNISKDAKRYFVVLRDVTI